MQYTNLLFLVLGGCLFLSLIFGIWVVSILGKIIIFLLERRGVGVFGMIDENKLVDLLIGDSARL